MDGTVGVEKVILGIKENKGTINDNDSQELSVSFLSSSSPSTDYDADIDGLNPKIVQIADGLATNATSKTMEMQKEIVSDNEDFKSKWNQVMKVTETLAMKLKDAVSTPVYG